MLLLTRDKFLSDTELAALHRILDMYWDKDPRDTALIRLSLETGARPSELLSIKVKDLDSEKNKVLIHGIKGSRDREIPLRTALFKRLQELAAKKGPEDLLFPIALRTYQGIWQRYRPFQGKGIKSLRHTFAMKLYDKTKDIRLVQLALGHRAISTTMIYLEYQYTEKELRKLLL